MFSLLQLFGVQRKKKTAREKKKRGERQPKNTCGQP